MNDSEIVTHDISEALTAINSFVFLSDHYFLKFQGKD